MKVFALSGSFSKIGLTDWMSRKSFTDKELNQMKPILASQGITVPSFMLIHNAVRTQDTRSLADQKTRFIQDSSGSTEHSHQNTPLPALKREPR